MAELTPCPFCPTDGPMSKRTTLMGQSFTKCNACLCTKPADEWEIRPIEDELRAENERLVKAHENVFMRGTVHFKYSMGLKAKLEKAKETIKKMDQHCLCQRFVTFGFDYGEIHERLGKPKAGARWHAPSDISTATIKDIEGGE